MVCICLIGTKYAVDGLDLVSVWLVCAKMGEITQFCSAYINARTCTGPQVLTSHLRSEAMNLESKNAHQEQSELRKRKNKRTDASEEMSNGKSLMMESCRFWAREEAWKVLKLAVAASRPIFDTMLQNFVTTLDSCVREDEDESRMSEEDVCSFVAENSDDFWKSFV